MFQRVTKTDGDFSREPDPRRFAVKRREEPRIRAESRGISGESAAPAVRRRPGGRIGWGKRRGEEEARREREVRRGEG